MALVFSNLGASASPDINDSTDAAIYTNTSWTPPTSGLIWLFVQSSRSPGPDTPTVSGNGLTWVQIGTTLNAGSNRGLTLFAANAAGAVAGVTTITFPGTQLACMASFGLVTGADLSGGVAAAFVQQVSNGATTGAGTVSLTLAAAANSSNRPLACFFHVVNETATARANWTAADVLQGTSYNRCMLTEWRADAFETTASFTHTTSSGWGGMAVEIKALVNTYTLALANGSFVLSGQAVTLTYTAKVSITVSQTVLLTSKFETSVSHVSTNDLANGNATARTRAETALAPALEWHRVSVHSFGSGDPWKWDGTGSRPADPWNWTSLDLILASVLRMAGNIILGFGNWSWFLKGNWNGTTTTALTAADELADTKGRPYTNSMTDVLHYVDVVCRRYMQAPWNVRYWQLGSWEFHGFFVGRDPALVANGPGHDGSFNHYAYDAYAGTSGHADMGMAYLHNQVATQLIATAASLGIARSALKIITNYPPTPSNGNPVQQMPAGSPLRDRVWGNLDKRVPEAIHGHLLALDPTLWDIWAWDMGLWMVDGVIPAGATDWNATTKYTDLINYFAADAAALGFGSRPYFISESYPKPLFDPGANSQIYRKAIAAECYRRIIEGGVSQATIWSTIGRANDPPDGNTDAALHSSVGTSTGGQPQPMLDLIQMLNDHFSAGTQIRSLTVSDANKATALANPSAVMVINHLDTPLRAVINTSTSAVLDPYETRLVTFAQAYTLSAGTGTFTLTGKAVNLKVGRKLVIVRGIFTLTGQALNFVHAYRLALSFGSFALTAPTTLLKAGRKLTIAQGSYTLTGFDARLIHQPPYAIATNAGFFALSGQAVNLRVARKLSLSAGTFTLSGQSVALRAGRKLALTAGALALSGQDVTLRAARTMGAEHADYVLSGQDVRLLAARTLAIDTGAFTLTGQDVALLRAALLALDTGSFALSGQAVSLLAGYRLSADMGAFTLTGIDVGLVYTPQGSYLLIAEVGTFALAGQDMSLLAERQLAAGSGSFALTGQDVALRAARSLSLEAGQFALNGQFLTFVWSAAPDIPPPAERIFVVPVESRIVSIAFESRVFVVQE